MALGLMCQFLESKNKRDGTVIYENIIVEKSLQLGAFKNNKYTINRISSTYHNNVDEHLKIVPKLVENNFKSFRLSVVYFHFMNLIVQLFIMTKFCVVN